MTALSVVPLARGAKTVTSAQYRRYVHGVTVVDNFTGQRVTGTVDLKPTIDRINAKGSYPHVNDGSVFRNQPLKGKSVPELPVKPQGYYREYVHPTAGFKGPGPQRIVVGQNGEIFYTPDHHQTFRRIK